MNPTAAIIIPTLNIRSAAETGARAQALAGVATCVVIVADCERRGGIIPANAAIQAALALEAPFIVYLNDDCEIEQQGWLARLIEALESNPVYGIACPSGNCPGGPQRTAGPGAEPGVFVVEAPLAWFCAVIRRELIAELGFFDPAFVHYCGDSDLTCRAQAAGWKSVWVRDVYVRHLGGEVDQALKKREKALWRSRWHK